MKINLADSPAIVGAAPAYTSRLPRKALNKPMSETYTKQFRTHAIVSVTSRRADYDQDDAASYMAAAISKGLEPDDRLEEVTVYERDPQLVDKTGNFNNDMRALTAQTALDAFCEETGAADDGLASQISDLLASLRHLADRNETDWDEMLERAMRHYESEVAAEERGKEESEEAAEAAE